jgi:hypothetical protein
MSPQDQDSQVPSKLVTALNTETAVVTYRAVVGGLAFATATLVGVVGNNIVDGIKELQASMIQVQLSISHSAGRIDAQDSRLGRVEQSVDTLNARAGSLDNRVTRIEAVSGIK